MYLATFRLQITVLVVSAINILPAIAEQLPPVEVEKNSPSIQKVEITAIAKSYDPRRDDTAAKIVLNHDEIVKYGDTNVFDVLKRVPGVTVSGSSGRAGEIRMRGLGNGYTQILLNGERVTAGFSIESLAPDMIERIEVMRAATAEFSTQAIAGTINIILTKAVKTAERELKVSVGAGEGGGGSPRVIFQISDKKDQLSYSLTTNAYRNNFDRTSSIEEGELDSIGRTTLRRDSTFHDNGHTDSLNLAPRLNWTYLNGDTLTFQSYINLNRYARTSELLVDTSLGSQPSYPYVEDRIAWGNQFLRSDLSWATKLNPDSKLDMKIGGVFGKLQHDLWQRAYASQNGNFLLDELVKGRSTERGYSLTGKYTLQMNKEHSLALGWDGGRNSRDESRLDRQQILPGVSPVGDSNEAFSATVERVALFAQDDWSVTPQWAIYFGLRWEGVATKVSGNTFTESSSRSSVWSPLFQTLYKIPGSKGDQFRFALTRTYKAPSTSNLIPRRFATANNSATELDFQGNPDLRPELALGFDAAYEHYWSGGGMFSISASKRQIDGYIRNFTFLAPNGRWTSQPINDGKASTHGLELETKFPLKSVFADAPALDLRASLSHNWSSVQAVPGPNNRIDQQTPIAATLGIDFKDNQLTLGGSYVFKNGGSVRQSITQSTFNSVRRDLEMYAMWKFNPKQLMRIYLSNILAQDSFNDRTYSDDNGTLRRTGIYPNNVNVRITLETKF